MSGELETWRPVVGYEGYYEVSDLGCVRSTPRLDNRGRRKVGRMLRAGIASNGYPLV